MHPHAPSSKVARLSVFETTAAWRPTTNGAAFLAAAASGAGGTDAGANAAAADVNFIFPLFLLLVPSVAML